CTCSYTIKAGDICDSISATNNLQLAVINDNIIDPKCNNLVPGFILCLRWQGWDCSTTH
ncbi:hypothetical protein HD554DRAFT_2017686, partial [Boletus coccyginus]